MSEKLFKKLLCKRYPTMSANEFDTEKFAKSFGNLMNIRKYQIGQIVNVTDGLRSLRKKLEPANKSPPCELENIDLRAKARNLAPTSPSWDVLAAVAADDRGSSGGSDVDIDEMYVQEEDKKQLSIAFEKDLKRLFSNSKLSNVKRIKHAKSLAAVLNVYEKELTRYIR